MNLRNLLVLLFVCLSLTLLNARVDNDEDRVDTASEVKPKRKSARSRKKLSERKVKIKKKKKKSVKAVQKDETNKITIINHVSGPIELKFRGCTKSYYEPGSDETRLLELGKNEIYLFKDDVCDFTKDQKFLARGMSGHEPVSMTNSLKVEPGKTYKLDIRNASFILEEVDEETSEDLDKDL